MPSRRKKGANDKHKDSTPTSNTDLQAPPRLHNLDTPTSTPQLACSPSDLTPPVSALNKLSINSSNRAARPVSAVDLQYSFANMFASSPPPHGPAAAPAMEPQNNFPGFFAAVSPPKVPDIHNKLQAGTPRYSRTEAVKGFGRAFSASKKLQQIMGIQDPEPFVSPPEMPEGLEQAFTEGLDEYGMDYKTEGMDAEAFGGAAGMQDGMLDMGLGMEKTTLPNITEEMESPVKAAHNQPSARAPAPYASYESDTDVGETTPGYSGSVADGSLGSSSTLAEDQSSRPGSSATTSRHVVEPATSNSAAVPADLNLFARALDYGGEYGDMGAGYPPTQQSASYYALPQYHPNPIPADVPHLSYKYTPQGDAQGYENAAQRPDPAPIVLFPSPRVEARSAGFVHTRAGFVPHGFVPGGYAPGIPSAAGSPFPTGLFGQSQTLKAPKITVQSPSPKKIPTSKKRAPSLSTQDLFGPPHTRARAEDSTGLPTLPVASEAMWKFHFPGNTHALLTILLTWSFAMQSFYNRLPNPKTFPVHSAFPYPVSPPIHQRLLSVSFYDTSVEPHKEIRFLGPGDAADIFYGEVDTFRSQEDRDAFQEQQKQDCKVEALKRKLGIDDTSNQRDVQHTAMDRRAATGEGRWTYILIKGHQTSKEETAPHVMLAFHISAVTDESTCLHTILPETHIPAAPHQLPVKPPLQRFSSLQNLKAPLRNPVRLHQTLRSASSAELPRADAAKMAPQDGAQTLRRTILKMEKAGSMPLIEGYRVDVGKFRGWLDAVGRGNGKVIMWRERE